MEGTRITDLPGLQYLWKVENLYLAGQPSLDSFEAIKDLGITKIINLRGEGELDFGPEIAKVNELQMEYVQFPIVVDSALNYESCKKLSEMLDTDNPHFIHCGSANRVGGWLITYLVLYRNVEFEAAVEVAYANGLTSHVFVDHAKAIIDQARG